MGSCWRWNRSTQSRAHPVHYHPRREERFEVLSGEVHALVGGEERTLREEVLVIPPRIPHGTWAERAGTSLNWQTRPAPKTEAFLEAVWGLARDGRTNDKGIPNSLLAAVVTREYEQEYRLVSLPRAVQTVLFGPLAAVGRSLGYRGWYPYPRCGPGRAFEAAGERSSVASRARVDAVVLVAVALGFLILFLLR